MLVKKINQALLYNMNIVNDQKNLLRKTTTQRYFKTQSSY